MPCEKQIDEWAGQIVNKSKTTRSKNIHTHNVLVIPINEGKKYSTYYCLVIGSEEASNAGLRLGR